MSRYALLPDVKNLVLETGKVFAGVARREIGGIDFDKVTLTRLNQQYETALSLCKIFAERSGLEFGPGRAVGRGFFVSMNVMFERAVTNVLRRHIPYLSAQRPVRSVRRVRPPSAWLNNGTGHYHAGFLPEARIGCRHQV